MPRIYGNGLPLLQLCMAKIGVFPSRAGFFSADGPVFAARIAAFLPPRLLGASDLHALGEDAVGRHGFPAVGVRA